MLCRRLLVGRRPLPCGNVSSRVSRPQVRIAQQTRPFFGLASVQRWLSGLKDYPNENKMLSVTAALKPDQHTSPNFGDVQEVEIKGIRVWFQSNKIILGDFNDEWEVEEEYNISRIPNEDYQLDEFEMLGENIVPLPQAQELSRSYFSNTYARTEQTDFPAMTPKKQTGRLCTYLLCTLYYLRAVLGFIVFHNHTGVALDYDWVSLKSTEEFESDLEKALQIWQAVKTLEKKENFEDKEKE